MSTEGPLFVWPSGGELVERKSIRRKEANSSGDQRES